MTGRRGRLAAAAVGLGLVGLAVLRLPDLGLLPGTKDQQEYLGPSGDTAMVASYRSGRELWSQGDSASLVRAIAHFQEALDRDPRYAEAYAGRASVYVALGCRGYSSPGDAFPKARAAALTALQLDSTLREPHTALGNYYRYYERDSVRAEHEFRIGNQDSRRSPCRHAIPSGR